MVKLNASPKSRDPWFDNAKIIVLAVIVFDHLIEPFNVTNPNIRLLSNAFSLFSMPTMIFLLGMFSRPPKTRADWLMILYQNLVLYLLVQAVFIVAIAALRAKSLPETFLSLDLWFRPQYGLWFLFAMGAWRASIAIIPRAWWVLPLSFAVAIFAGQFDGIDRFFSLSRILVFAPIFLLGFVFGDVISQRLRAMPKMIGGAILLSAIAICAIVFTPKSATLLLEAAVPYSEIGLAHTWVWRAFYYVLAGGASAGVLVLAPRKLAFYTILGQRTLYLYLLHLLCARAAYYLIYPATASLSVLILIFAASLLLTWALTHARVVSVLRPIFAPDFRRSAG